MATLPPDNWRSRMEDNLEELAAVTLGKRQTELEGGGRHHDGLIHNVGRISERLDQVAKDVGDIKGKIGNGGIRVRLTAGQWATVAALIGLASAVVGAITSQPTP